MKMYHLQVNRTGSRYDYNSYKNMFRFVLIDDEHHIGFGKRNEREQNFMMANTEVRYDKNFNISTTLHKSKHVSEVSIFSENKKLLKWTWRLG